MNALLTYWKQRLKLQDWTIKLIEDCNVHDFKIQDVCGETEWDIVNKCAIIRIISKKEYGDRLLRYDFERILIHEMLHIKFSLLWETNDDNQNLILHQYIEDMARILCELHKRETTGLVEKVE